MSDVRNEVVLSRRVVPQPQPHMYTGGDCGACVLGGLFGLTVPEVYERLCGGKVEGPTWWSLRERLHVAKSAGLADRLVDEVPLWPFGIAAQAWFGLPARNQGSAWFKYLRMALDAGYYGVAEVNHGKAGPVAGSDHVVLICGTRELWPEESGAIHQQILVSCSSRATPDEEWVEVQDFLTQRGGFNCFLVRPVAP